MSLVSTKTGHLDVSVHLTDESLKMSFSLWLVCGALMSKLKRYWDDVWCGIATLSHTKKCHFCIELLVVVKYAQSAMCRTNDLAPLYPSVRWEVDHGIAWLFCGLPSLVTVFQEFPDRSWDVKMCVNWKRLTYSDIHGIDCIKAADRTTENVWETFLSYLEKCKKQNDPGVPFAL